MHGCCFARAGTHTVEEGGVKDRVEKGRLPDVGTAEEGDFGYELRAEGVGGGGVGLVLLAPFGCGPEFARGMSFDERCCGLELRWCGWGCVPMVC